MLTQTREITIIDLKILKALLEDGRMSFTDIAKECGTTKSSVGKHYRQLEKAGIIVGSTIQVNYAAFGYLAVGSLSFTVEHSRIQESINKIKSIPNIPAVQQVGKTSSINLLVIMKDLNELERTREIIRTLPTANEIITNVWTGIKTIYENLSIFSPIEQALYTNSSSKKLIPIQKTESKTDETDIKIVEELAKNGRASFQRIAKNISSSTNTVARRYEKLKENGIIKVTIQFNPKKLGYHAFVSFNIILAQSSIDTVTDTIAKIPDVTEILKLSGRFDLLVFAMVKDINQLLCIQDEIACIEGVKSVEEHVYRVERWESLPSPREYISTF